MLTDRKVAARSWFGRRGTDATLLLYIAAILWALHGHRAPTLRYMRGGRTIIPKAYNYRKIFFT